MTEKAARTLPCGDIGSTLPYPDAEKWQNLANANDAWLASISCEGLTNVAGTANDITANTRSASVSAITSYQLDKRFVFVPVSTNTGGATLNIDGLGAKAIKDLDGNTLDPGDIVAGRLTMVTDVGAHFRLGADGTAAGSLDPSPGLYLRDEKAQNTAGGSATSGAWQTRTLNTVVGTNNIPGASLSANQFTLAVAGTYYIQARAPAQVVDQHQTRLFNVTDNVVVPNGIGSSVRGPGGTFSHNDSFLRVKVTITTATTFRLEHRVTTTRATDGFGSAANFTTEVYAEVMVWQVGAVVSQVDGQPGGPVTIAYDFDTTVTDSDPGAGKLRLGTASPQTSSVVLRADLLDVFGNDVTNLLDNSDDSTSSVKARLKLVKQDDPTRYIDFNLTAAVATPSGYRNLTVASTANGSAGTSPFSNGDRVLLMIDRTGDKGDAGNPGADSSNNLGFSRSIENCAISVTVSGNVMTIAAKDKDGNNPTAGSPIRVAFRSTTAAGATWVRRDGTAALSMTVSAGSALGFAASETNVIHVGFIDNAGTLELAVSKDGAIWADDRTINTTAEGGAGGADSGETLYSTTARSGVACRLAAVVLIQTGATAGNWSNAPTRVTNVQHGIATPYKNAVRGWADYTTITTTAVNDGFNISSVTDNGTGDTTVTWAVAMGSATYAVTQTPENSGASMTNVFLSTAKSASVVRLAGAYGTAGGLNDSKMNMMAVGW